MAYTRPEDLGNSAEKRVIWILSLTNVVGGIAGGVLTWNLGGLLGLPSSGMSLGTVLRFVLVAAGAAAGVLATFRWSGISLLDQVVLWGGFSLRRSTGATLLKPPVAARAAAAQLFAPLLRDGVVIAEVYDPNEAEPMRSAA